MKTAEMWDTWMFFEDGVHYLFYLHKSNGTVWDGISLATSRDGVHFEEMGVIIEKRADAAWLGTGSTWRVDGQYALNYSEERGGVQGIYFATSKDLLHWTKRDEIPMFQPNPRWYDDTATGRWDCIWVVKQAEDKYTGYLTARPWSRHSNLSCVSVGKVTSADGLHFEAAAPPRFIWEGIPPMNVYEVGAVERIGGRYYMIIGMSEDSLGNRQLWRQNVGNTGMYCFVSDTVDGPFALQQAHPRLLVSEDRMTYFARFYPFGNRMLLSHHSVERCNYPGKRAGVWMATLKTATPDEQGALRLGYYEGNDALSGERIPLRLDQACCVYPALGNRDFQSGSDCLRFRQIAQGQIVMTEAAFEPHVGAMIQATLRVDEAGLVSGTAGFYFQHVETPCGELPVKIGIPDYADGATLPSGTGIFFSTKGVCELGRLWESGKFDVDNVVDIGIEVGRTHRVLILVRNSMLEIYLDGWLVQCYSMAAFPSGRFGFACENAAVDFSDLAAWTMTL